MTQTLQTYDCGNSRKKSARERAEKNRNAAFWCEDRSTNAFLNGDKHAFFKKQEAK